MFNMCIKPFPKIIQTAVLTKILCIRNIDFLGLFVALAKNDPFLKPKEV